MFSELPLSKIKVGKVSAYPSLTWAEGLTVSLPLNLAKQLSLYFLNENEIHLNELLNDENIMSLSTNALEELKFRSAYTNNSPLSSRLPMNYQSIPPGIRDRIAKVLGRFKRNQLDKSDYYPAWPIDLSVDFVSDLSGLSQPETFNEKTPVLLTHDLDTMQGLENLTRYFLDIEEDLGARSCSYVVPCSWPVNHALLDQVVMRGHELGIHGYDHSNKTPFMRTTDRQRRLKAAGGLIDKYAMKGYRAPSLLRTEGLLVDLSKMYRYDSSIPTSGGLFPVPNNGCATARPFKIGNIWELPISMPRDGSLLFLGYSPRQILDLWIQCAELISRSGGVINLLTHCEDRFSGKDEMRDIYRQFLKYLAKSDMFEFILPNHLINKLQGI